MKSFAENLKEQRIERGFTKKEFAEYMGIPFDTYKAYEQGSRTPKIEVILNFAKALNVSVDYLVGMDEEKNHLSPNLMFNSDEEELIRKFRLVNPRLQRVVMEILDVAIDFLESDSDQEAYPIPMIEKRYYYGRPSAGAGNGALDLDGIIRIRDSRDARKADFVLQVDGRSMEPEFKDGDFVLVKSQDDIEDGEIGIWCVDGEIYIKEKNGNTLHSLNPEYEDVPLTDFSDIRCYGKVIGKAEI